jgi:hypothetical protein
MGAGRERAVVDIQIIGWRTRQGQCGPLPVRRTSASSHYRTTCLKTPPRPPGAEGQGGVISTTSRWSSMSRPPPPHRLCLVRIDTHDLRLGRQPGRSREINGMDECCFLGIVRTQASGAQRRGIGDLALKIVEADEHPRTRNDAIALFGEKVDTFTLCYRGARALRSTKGRLLRELRARSVRGNDPDAFRFGPSQP